VIDLGSYTRVGLVRSATGFSLKNSPSYTVAFCIRRGEASMKKYLGITPPSAGCLATGTQISDGTNMIWNDATTSFAAYHLHMRLASQNAPHAYYARDLSVDRGARFLGHAAMASVFWEDGIRICDMHGRSIVLERVEPANK